MEQLDDFMQDVAPSVAENYFLFCVSPNPEPLMDLDANTVQFNTIHVWDQLTCYPSLFDWLAHKTNYLPYLIPIKDVFTKYHTVFEKSTNFGYLCQNARLLAEASVQLFQNLITNSNDYAVGQNFIHFRYFQTCLQYCQTRATIINDSMEQRLTAWQQNKKIIAAKGIVKVSMILTEKYTSNKEKKNN